MVRRTLLTAAMLAAFAMPALAAAPKAKTYYAEQSVKTQACYVVPWKPSGMTATMIGTDSYSSMGKAAAAIKADTNCKAPAKVMKTKAPATPKPATPAKT
jgi:hypothetical protein